MATGGSNAHAVNPFRYRGYYFDIETSLYYLQSRYYNPEWGRFLNADSALYSGLLGCNLYAYCENNPIMYIDPYGESGFAGALSWWASSGWTVALAEPTVIGELIYAGGCVILGGLAVVETMILVDTVSTIACELDDSASEPDEKPNEGGKDEEIPDVKYPGDDPTVAPDGYEWTGKDKQGGKRGGYKNPNGKDSWHPDLDHPDGIDPHWDYNDGNKGRWRVFPDRIERVK